jgi:hypothetical protein
MVKLNTGSPAQLAKALKYFSKNQSMKTPFNRKMLDGFNLNFYWEDDESKNLKMSILVDKDEMDDPTLFFYKNGEKADTIDSKVSEHLDKKLPLEEKSYPIIFALKNNADNEDYYIYEGTVKNPFVEQEKEDHRVNIV